MRLVRCAPQWWGWCRVAREVCQPHACRRPRGTDARRALGPPWRPVCRVAVWKTIARVHLASAVRSQSQARPSLSAQIACMLCSSSRLLQSLAPRRGKETEKAYGVVPGPSNIHLFSTASPLVLGWPRRSLVGIVSYGSFFLCSVIQIAYIPFSC